MSTQKFNGWTNYPTWCVAVWLSNDRQTQQHWQAEMQRIVDESVNAPSVKDGLLTVPAAAQCQLADALKSHFQEYGFCAEPTLYGEILRACLESVNWDELATDLLEAERPNFRLDPTAHLRGPAEFRFSLGRLVSTPGALGELTLDDITVAVNRHVRGDWGLVCKDDALENELALQEGFRLLSVYESSGGTRFWIITEADRSVTTVLLPAEY